MMDVSRRGFLSLGTALILTRTTSRLAGKVSGRGGEADKARVAVQWAGDATATSAQLAALTVHGRSVAPAVSPNPDMSDATVLGRAAPGPQGWNVWVAEGLSPNTSYYWQLTNIPAGGTLHSIGPIARFKTLNAPGAPCTIRRAVGSCNGADRVNTAVFDDIVAWNPDRVQHLGDLGYPSAIGIDLDDNRGTHIRAYTAILEAASLATVLPRFCVDYVRSDHDSGTGNNGPSDDGVTAANTRAWQAMVPARIDRTASGLVGVWRSEVEGRVRFIKLDYRNSQRSNVTGRPPDDPDSTMLGPAQLSWLYSELDAAATAGQLVVLLTDTGWNGVAKDPVIPAQNDKYPAYVVEREAISDYAAAKGLDMIIVHGDSHLLMQDQSHETNGYVVIGCSPFDRHAQGWFQTSYDEVYPTGALATGGNDEVQQYQRLTWSDDGTTITFTAQGFANVMSGPDARMEEVTRLIKTYTPGRLATVPATRTAPSRSETPSFR